MHPSQHVEAVSMTQDVDLLQLFSVISTSLINRCNSEVFFLKKKKTNRIQDPSFNNLPQEGVMQ